MAISDSEATAIVNGISRGIRETLGKELASLATTVRVLANTVEQLRGELADVQTKSAGSLRYKGVWTAREIYDENDMVTYGGTVWFCTKKHASENFAHQFFKLMAKNGRAAKATQRAS